MELHGRSRRRSEKRRGGANGCGLGDAFRIAERDPRRASRRRGAPRGVSTRLAAPCRGPASHRARPASCTSATPAPPSSTGPTPAATRGALVLRIEDTDRERSTREFETALLGALAWLGHRLGRGPGAPERAPRAPHRGGGAARSRAGAPTAAPARREELEARRQATIAAGGKWTYDGRCRDAGHGPDAGPHTVRLRVPQQGRLEWDDLVYGPSGQDAARDRRRDPAAQRRHAPLPPRGGRRRLDQRIDTVIRGADHFLNTCIHLAIYEALDAPPPRFGHVPAARRRRRQEALEAPRRGGRRALPRGRLPARGDAQLAGAPRLVPRRPGDLLAPRRSSRSSTSTRSGARRPRWTRTSSPGWTSTG